MKSEKEERAAEMPHVSSDPRKVADWLSFGKGNAKLGEEIATFSIPAGWTCPGASQCLARANRETGVIQDGSNQAFRCFAASAEAAFPSVRKSRWNNFEKLKGLSTEQMVALIVGSLPKAKTVRIHVSGDFFSEAYFLAWLEVAIEALLPQCLGSRSEEHLRNALRFLTEAHDELIIAIRLIK